MACSFMLLGAQPADCYAEPGRLPTEPNVPLTKTYTPLQQHKIPLGAWMAVLLADGIKGRVGPGCSSDSKALSYVWNARH